jgi:DNA-binding helix-hairpin-helix protein with protein kinase domain
MRLRAKHGRYAVTLGPEIGSGGQGTVYRDATRPDVALKLPDHPPQDYERKLDAMIAQPPHGLHDPAAPAAAAWPSDVVIDADGRCVGHVTPLVPGRIPIGELFNPATCPAGTDYRVLVTAARNVCTIAARFHAAGVVGGDVFNPRNLLADPASGNVTAIDCDSAQVRAGGRVFEGQGWMVEYTAPRFQTGQSSGTSRTPADDQFAVHVLGFQALMGGHHPYGGVPRRGGKAAPIGTRIANGWWAYGRKGAYRPPKSAPPFDGLPADLRSLFRQCFEDGHADPIRRPAAQTLADALDDWLAAGVRPPTRATPAGPCPPAAVPEWAVRAGNWIEKHPGRTWAAIAAALGLIAGCVWWTNREPEPPGPGGKPTPALWKKLRPESGR